MMLTLYFSGTGNTQFIAEMFSQRMNAACHSIEERVDFDAQMARHEHICFCYPIYGSCVPQIMQAFVQQHINALSGKKLLIFCTQNAFSGDGARVFTDLLQGVDYQVIYAAHFGMPNNICNLFFYPIAGPKRLEKYKLDAQRKLDRICEDIRQGKMRRTGFNPFSKLLGFLTQRVYFRRIMIMAQSSVRISAACNTCLICARACPVNNLEVRSGRLTHNDKCVLCFRCVNRCPQKAITVLHHGKVRRQYKGLPVRSDESK